MTVFENVAALRAAGPGPLGSSDWFEVTQPRIDGFADATGDHNWIHVDPGRARRGPFGSTIAHGYLTLSLINKDLPQIFSVENVEVAINYGLNRVRFPSPVVVGSRLRLTGELKEVTAIGEGAVQAVVDVMVEIKGEAKPACVAETVSRFYPPAHQGP